MLISRGKRVPWIISKDPALSGKDPQDRQLQLLRPKPEYFDDQPRAGDSWTAVGEDAGAGLQPGDYADEQQTEGLRRPLPYWRAGVYSATRSEVNIAAKLKPVQQEEAVPRFRACCRILACWCSIRRDGRCWSEGGTINEKSLWKRMRRLAAGAREARATDHAEAGRCWDTKLLEAAALFFASPIAAHHQPEKVLDPLLRKLAELVQLSGSCAEIFVESPAADTIASVRKTLRAVTRRHGT